MSVREIVTCQSVEEVEAIIQSKKFEDQLSFIHRCQLMIQDAVEDHLANNDQMRAIILMDVLSYLEEVEENVVLYMNES